jgi:type IV pilus assembly protein PilX
VNRIGCFRARPIKKQSGVVLFFVLVFMVILTGVAVFSMRGATLGERLARNQLDRNLALQAAEAALRDAENDLRMNPNPKPGDPPSVFPLAGARCSRVSGGPSGLPERPFLSDASGLDERQWTDTCIRGQCAWRDDSFYATKAPWERVANGGQWNNNQADKLARCDFAGGVPIGTFTGTAVFQGVGLQPEYIIETRKVAGSSAFQYRITARGFGANPRTEVMLQSELRLDFKQAS